MLNGNKEYEIHYEYDVDFTAKLCKSNNGGLCIRLPKPIRDEYNIKPRQLILVDLGLIQFKRLFYKQSKYKDGSATLYISIPVEYKKQCSYNVGEYLEINIKFNKTNIKAYNHI